MVNRDSMTSNKSNPTIRPVWCQSASGTFSSVFSQSYARCVTVVHHRHRLEGGNAIVTVVGDTTTRSEAWRGEPAAARRVLSDELDASRRRCEWPGGQQVPRRFIVCRTRWSVHGPRGSGSQWSWTHVCECALRGHRIVSSLSLCLEAYLHYYVTEIVWMASRPARWRVCDRTSTHWEAAVSWHSQQLFPDLWWKYATYGYTTISYL